MKKIMSIAAAAASVLSLASCNKEAMETYNTITVKVTNQDSKITLDGMSFVWENADILGALGVNPDGTPKADALSNVGGGCFSGKLNSKQGGGELDIIYPYSADMYKKSDKRIFEIPFSVEQTAVKDGLPLFRNSSNSALNGKAAVVLIGRTTTKDGAKSVEMECKTALLKFSIKRTDITEVHFTMSTPMITAERLYFCSEEYSDETKRGYLYSEDGWMETNTVVIKPQGEKFEPGTYYASVIPNIGKPYSLTVAMINAEGKKADRTSRDKESKEDKTIVFSPGKIRSIAGDIALDEAITNWSSIGEKKTSEFDFSQELINDSSNEVPKPVFVSASGSINLKNSNSEKMGVKADKDYSIVEYEGVKCFKFQAGSKTPYLSNPPFSGYTVSNAVIEFAKQPSNDIAVYFGKGSLPNCHIEKNEERVLPVGGAVTVTPWHVTSYNRYYVSFGSASNNYNTITEDIYIKKITFNYVRGSFSNAE